MAKNNETTVKAEVVEAKVEEPVVETAEVTKTQKASFVDKVKNFGRKTKTFIVEHKAGLIDTAMVAAAGATLLTLNKLVNDNNKMMDRANEEGFIEYDYDDDVDVIDAESTVDSETKVETTEA